MKLENDIRPQIENVSIALEPESTTIIIALRIAIALVASIANLLAPKQRSIYHHIINELIKQGKKVTPKNFVEFIKD